MKENFSKDKVHIAREMLTELLQEANIPLGEAFPMPMSVHDVCISREHFDAVVKALPNGLPRKVRKHVQKFNRAISQERQAVVCFEEQAFAQAKRHAYTMISCLQGCKVVVKGVREGLLVGLGQTKTTLKVMVKKPECLASEHGWGAVVRHQRFSFPDRVPPGGIFKWWLDNCHYSIAEVIEVPALDVDMPPFDKPIIQ